MDYQRNHGALSCSKPLHANDIRSGFLLLRAMFLSLFVFSTANLKGAQEKESVFAVLYQNLEHLMNSYMQKEMLTELNSYHLLLVCVGKHGCFSAGISPPKKVMHLKLALKILFTNQL